MNRFESYYFTPPIRNLVAAEDVLPSLMAWHRMGLKFALVTLVNVVGSSPRALGSVMAVSSHGHSAGYLSGGCLERAIIDEARLCISNGRNRLVRYGKDSPYFDIKLPCGSGIDVFIDQGIDVPHLARLQALSLDRKAVVHVTDLETGRNEISIARDPNEQCRLDGHIFWRIVLPTTRVHLVGAGPAVPAIAHLLSAIGFSTEIVCPDDPTREEIRSFGLNCKALTNSSIEALEGDRWSAAILAFHEHEWELPLLEKLLHSDCFYIGVLGSKAVAERRVVELQGRGIDRRRLARLRAPIGLIAGTKSRLSLAVSVVSELVSEAMNRSLIQ